MFGTRPANDPQAVGEIMTPRQKVCRIVGAVVIALLFVSDGFAYDEFSHRQIVIDAFNYILVKAEDETKYSDGTTARADFALVRSIFASSESGTNAAKRRLRAIAETLGTYAMQTDQQPDVVLDLPALGYQPSAVAPNGTRYFFTMFSHFVNMHRPGSLWPVAGYNYLWVENNERCKNPTNEDLFGNLFVRYGGAKVVPSASAAMINFRGKLRSDLAPSAYDRNFTNAIRFVEFWPLDNVAEFWHKAFVMSPPARDATPYNYQYLSHLLHAIADATVPYHAVGISGCGHRAYERAVDVLLKEKKLVDYSLVENYLMTESFLSINVDVAEIIRGIARVASDQTTCICDGVTCDCPMALKDPEKVGKKLVNLAVAASVITIRQALSQWKQQRSKTKPVAKPSVPGQTKKEDVKAVFGDFPVLTEKDWFEVTRAHATITFEPEVVKTLSAINKLIVGYEKQRLTPAKFRDAYTIAVNDWAAVATKYPVMLGYHVNLARKPLEFRDPTLAEIRDEKKWAQYLEGRQRFYAAVNLLDAGIESGLLKSRAARAVGAGEKELLETSLRAVGSVQEMAIRALAEGG